MATPVLGVALAIVCLLVKSDAANTARDLAGVSQNGLKLWVTVDARVDHDNGRVVQWNDISHGENHLKQNHAEKSPGFELGEDGETVVFRNNAFVSSQPIQLFDTPSSGLTVMIMFKHFEAPGDKATSAVMFNYGAGGLKVQNQNLEIGIKVKGESCVFFAHRGSGRMTTSSKVTLKASQAYHLLTVTVGEDEHSEAESVGLALNGRMLKSVAKNKGWLNRGKYPTLSAPVDIGARVDGNKYEGTIGAHMGAKADMGFTGVISEVIVYGQELGADTIKELETALVQAQTDRTSDACLQGSNAEEGGQSSPLETSAEDQNDDSRWDFVTCMSAIKLRHKVLDVRLHSSEIGYGSGSQQQAVTGNPDSGDSNSYWQVRAASTTPSSDACAQGETLKHGDKIRLTHLGTKKNLHSHQYQSPLSQKQEVSGFGDNGDGDVGDDWELMVREKGDAYDAGWGGPWMRDSIVRLKHVVTGQYLFSHRKQFNNGPVEGHTEVTCSPRADDRTQWVVEEGIFHPLQK